MNHEKRSFYLFVLLPGGLIPLVVVFLFTWPNILSVGNWVHVLPKVHAVINAATAAILLFAVQAIRQGNIRLHRRLMYTCVVLGVLFLVSYVLYHASVAPVKYGDSDKDGYLAVAEQVAVRGWRTLYLIVLVSHITLSVPVVFLVLFALHYARMGHFPQHRAIVRYTFPIWLYVSVSGVVVYGMMRPFY